MPIRRLLIALSLGLGLSFAAGSAYADTSAGTKKEPAKGKPGDACKTSADCDQSSQQQSCVTSKCAPMRVPPPT